jgi:hypothetical protein
VTTKKIIGLGLSMLACLAISIPALGEETSGILGCSLTSKCEIKAEKKENCDKRSECCKDLDKAMMSFDLALKSLEKKEANSAKTELESVMKDLSEMKKEDSCPARSACIKKLFMVKMSCELAMKSLEKNEINSALEKTESAKKSLTELKEIMDGKRIINAKCPMIGGKVDMDKTSEKMTRMYKGIKIGFCCAGCPEAWDKLSDKEKSGRLSKLMEVSHKAKKDKTGNEKPVAAKADSYKSRLRVIIETDAGGDPDDEQSLVRFLLYSNEWDVEGIICNRPITRSWGNHNPERTGLGIVQRLVKAYGESYPNLVKHDPRYPKPEVLLCRTVAGYNDTDEAVNLIIAAVDRDDPRPVWYSDWGSDDGSATVNLKRALDKVLAERGPKGYARFKDRLRLVSSDQFGDHKTKLTPPFKLWVDTFWPEQEGKRWYHRFSALTATAGGFDLKRNVLTDHGPLGALYPTNTDLPQKEGDSMTFLYLVPTGMNDPEQPAWGSWAGRYGRNENYAEQPYYWANITDTWQGTTNRDNTLKRWSVHLQNDFKARLDWCTTNFATANHPPIARVSGELRRSVVSGEQVVLDASGSTDPDGQGLKFEWVLYSEPGSYRGPAPTIRGAASSKASFTAPRVNVDQTIHMILVVTDDGSPPLTRYQRAIVTVSPRRH